MSEIKVNKISPRSGTTVTLGDSGDTFTIPSGATINNQGTATNFGATGSASWVTTVKTGDFTAVAGEGYFVDTSSGAVEVTLPSSPTAGAVVAVSDYASNFNSNKCTLLRNGSNIGGQATNADLETEGIAVTLVYVDSTKGWIVTDDGLQSSAPGATYISACGGNTTITCGNFKTHIFTGPGTFTVNSVGNAAGSNSVEYLVVAGGGGAGTIRGGGGGAGGFRIRSTAPGCNSPLVAPANVPVSVQGYSIAVGGGGAGNGPVGGTPSTQATKGSDSSFSTITSTGGGFGGNNTPNAQMNGGPGGSGGGAGGQFCGVGGTGNSPPVAPAQGFSGGNDARPGTPGSGEGGAGGGGASAVGVNSAHENAGPGGLGSYIANPFIGPTAPSYGTSYSPGSLGSSRFFAGGGGGATTSSNSNKRGSGADGGGGTAGYCGSSTGANGTTNTGGGAGGGGPTPSVGGTGGSGIVMIRYQFQG